MKRKIRLGDLKRLLKESLISEEDVPAAVPEETEDSLDSQVDKYLAQYETEAKNAKTEGKDFRMLLRRILNEAGDGEDAGAEDAPAEDPPADEEPTKLSMDDLDVASFANSVVRLIDNYDSLLEVRSTLVRRAKNFLGKAYSPDVIDAFEQVMREEHGIVPGESKVDIDAEEFPAPGADRAGEGGAGGAPA